MLIADAINLAKSDKPDDIVKALLANKFTGWNGTITFPRGDGPYWQQWTPPMLFMQYTKAEHALRRGQDRLPARTEDRRPDAAQALSGRSEGLAGPSETSPMDFHLFSQYLLSGIVIGIIYSLMALGITFIYGIMKMINWSMGEFYMIGSYVQYALLASVLGWERWYLALPLSMASVFVLGVVVQRFLLRPMYVGGIERRDEYATIITIALMVLFRNLAIVLGGPNQYSPKDYAQADDAPAPCPSPATGWWRSWARSCCWRCSTSSRGARGSAAPSAARRRTAWASRPPAWTCCGSTCWPSAWASRWPRRRARCSRPTSSSIPRTARSRPSRASRSS